MRTFGKGIKTWLLSSALLVTSPILAVTVQAAQPKHNQLSHHQPSQRQHSTVLSSTHSRHMAGGYRTVSYNPSSHGMRGMHGIRGIHGMHAMAHRGYGWSSGGISCVPYARQVSGIQVAGNAWQWWDNSQGLYARGNRPEPGSVLNFRANGRMRLGHVAVVSHVVNSREVLIDQANWPTAGGYGGISHGVAVVDVSEANNWSAVRVSLGDGQFGSVYPTYGFIYNRADNGFVTARASVPAPQPVLNPPPQDLRPVAQRPWHTVEEVAEAPANGRHRVTMRFTPANLDFGK